MSVVYQPKKASAKPQSSSSSSNNGWNNDNHTLTKPRLPLQIQQRRNRRPKDIRIQHPAPMTLSRKRQSQIHRDGGFAHPPFCRRYGYHFAHIAYGPFFGEAAHTAGEFGGRVGAREAQWVFMAQSSEGGEEAGTGGHGMEGMVGLWLLMRG